MIKRYILGVITGLILGSIGAYAALSVKSTNVTFTPEDTKWNVTSVESTLNSLNERANFIDISNPDFPLNGQGIHYSSFAGYGGADVFQEHSAIFGKYTPGMKIHIKISGNCYNFGTINTGGAYIYSTLSSSTGSVISHNIDKSQTYWVPDGVEHVYTLPNNSLAEYFSFGPVTGGSNEYMICYDVNIWVTY